MYLVYIFCEMCVFVRLWVFFVSFEKSYGWFVKLTKLGSEWEIIRILKLFTLIFFFLFLLLCNVFVCFFQEFNLFYFKLFDYFSLYRKSLVCKRKEKCTSRALLSLNVVGTAESSQLFKWELLDRYSHSVKNVLLAIKKTKSV